MPFGAKVQCSKCANEYSMMWYQGDSGILCWDCNEAEEKNQAVAKADEGKSATPVEKPKSTVKKNAPKCVRSYKTRQNPNAVPKSTAPKGKGRRNIFKRNPPMKLGPPRGTFTIVSSIHHEGTYFRVGDIVSVRDVEGGIYYAQIKVLMEDEYCEKSASLTWLLPTRDDSPFPVDKFNHNRFIRGPDDDTPRRIECLQFVMHDPSYCCNNACGMPHPSQSGYVWGRLN